MLRRVPDEVLHEPVRPRLTRAPELKTLKKLCLRPLKAEKKATGRDDNTKAMRRETDGGRAGCAETGKTALPPSAAETERSCL